MRGYIIVICACDDGNQGLSTTAESMRSSVWLKLKDANNITVRKKKPTSFSMHGIGAR